MFREWVDIAKTDYDPNVSRVPELIGKHPGTIAPVVMWKPNPLQFVTPVSGSRVSDMIRVELKIREGNEELENNLKKIVLTIDGKRFEFDKPPCKVDFDTSQAHYRTIKLAAQAIGQNGEQEDAVLAKFYTRVIAENGAFDMRKPLLLFAGVIMPKIEYPRGHWSPDMYKAAFNFAKNIMTHLMHYGYVPDFLLEVDQFTTLIDPTQLNKGLEEYTPVKLVDVLGRETGPGCEGQTYTDMIETAQWMEKTKTKLGTVIRGYHFPEMGLPNGIPNIFEAFTAHIISNYWKYAPLGGVRGLDQTRLLFTDIMDDLEKNGINIPWDVHSLLIGEKPT